MSYMARNYLKGDTVVYECKKALYNDDLPKAHEMWVKIYEEASTEEVFRLTEQFTDNEVYTITDYGKAKAYRQMELEKIQEIRNNSKSLWEMFDKDEDLTILDDFMDFYEWDIIDNKIYDLECDCFVDEGEEKTNLELLQRVLDRASDYLIVEDYDTGDIVNFGTSEDYFNYFEDKALKYNKIASKYFNLDDYADNFLKELREDRKEYYNTTSGKEEE